MLYVTYILFGSLCKGCMMQIRAPLIGSNNATDWIVSFVLSATDHLAIFSMPVE